LQCPEGEPGTLVKAHYPEQQPAQRAVIFDVDGVLISTPHERAWQEALRVLMDTDWRDLAPTTTYTPERFTTAVYQEYVAGKPRFDGARAVLEHFGVAHADQLALVYGERKQLMIEELLQRGEFEAFPDGVRLVLALRARGTRLGVASSSKNANQFMERVPVDAFATDARLKGPAVASRKTLCDMFDANVCGRDLPRGKPDPAIFLLAAHELGIPPSSSIVVEDAPSGIQAAKAGGMLGLGVARHNDQALLKGAGADLVVASLDDVAVEALVEGRLERVREPAGGAAAV
jgi:beta-phosphoglucomutase